MTQRGTLAMVTLVIEIILIALLGVLLSAGFAVMAFTGPTAGATSGYNAGLTMISIAAIMAVGAGALHYHRYEMLDHAKLAREITHLREENRRAEQALEGARRDLRTLMTLQTARNDATAGQLADQLADRRASHH